MEIKHGSKINSWLLDENYLKNESSVSDSDMIHFTSICKFIYKFFITCPNPMFISWDKRHKSFYCTIGDKFCIVPYDTNISEYDYQDLLSRWVKRYYPRYEVLVDYERDYTSTEIAGLVQKGYDIDRIYNSKKIEKKKEVCVIERLLIKDDQIHVRQNDKLFILIARPDKPISEFISTFRKLKDDYEKQAFLKSYTKSIMEITYHKSVDIKYEGEMLKNFFRIRVLSLYNESLKETSNKLIHEWGRFVVHFSNDDQVSQCKRIIDHYKNEYKSIDNQDAYLIKQFNIKFGVRIKKKEKKDYSIGN
jgi:hypothetical protein